MLRHTLFFILLLITVSLTACLGTESNSSDDQDDPDPDESGDGDQDNDFDIWLPMPDGDDPTDGDSPTDGDDPTDGDIPTDGDDPTDGDTPTDGDDPTDGDTPPEGRSCNDPLPLEAKPGAISGNTNNAGNDYEGSCQADTSEERVYQLTLAEPTHLKLRANGFDTVMYLRSSCEQIATEIDCDDDDGGEHAAYLDVELQAGSYFLFVDGFGQNAGAYSLEIEIVCSQGEVSDPSTGDCVPDPCYPNPCTTPLQTTCIPELPSSFSCDCDSGYVMEEGQCVLEHVATGTDCSDPIPLALGEGNVSGSTSGAANSGNGSCLSWSSEGPDRIYTFTLAERRYLRFEMSGFDSVLHMRSTCTDVNTEIACNDDALEDHGSALSGFLNAGTYYLFADSYSDPGTYTLDTLSRSDPCAADPCPGLPECEAAIDWSSYECVCPAGTLPYNSSCVDDPCDPNPCNTAGRNRCEINLPGSFSCSCNVGFVEQTPGGICIEDTSAAEWAFFVFLNADNNLEDDGYDDLAEMGEAGSTANVSIVTLFDSYSQDNGDGRYLYVTQGGSTLIENLGEVDMSDWNTLAEFGEWAAAEYPARHHALVLWNHGAGWERSSQPLEHPLFKGFSNDDHGASNPEISVSNGDYARALNRIQAALGKKLDFVGFDACLMGMWEVAEATQPYAEVFVASQETEPVHGWSYDDFLPPLVANPAMEAETLAINIVQSYHDYNSENSTLAAVDLAELPDLSTRLSALANALIANPQIFSQVETIRDQTQQLYYYDEFRDLGHFAELLAALDGAPATVVSAAQALTAQLNDTVILSLNQSSHPNATGLSIYFPSNSSSVDTQYIQAAAVWSNHTTWDDFLLAFTN